MITMTLYYRGKNGSAHQFAQEMERQGIADRIRHQAGNLGYQYFSSLEDPETILLLDSWTDQAALDRHHASPMMQDILQLRKTYQLTVRAERYLSATDSIPPSDHQFLQDNPDQ